MEPCDALIVGAGPAGLGTALMLIRRGPWEKIIILEQRPAIDAEELHKSYVYKIDARGRSLTDSAGLSEAVKEAGMVSSTVPCTHVRPDGTTITLPFFSKGNEQHDVFITRSGLLKIMYEGLAKAAQQGRVRLICNTRLAGIQLKKDSAAIAPIIVRAVDAAGGDGKEMCFAPRLLVGADGMNSAVRRALVDWAPTSGLPADHFAPVVLNSPSAGLSFKVLQLPPNPPLRKPPARSSGPTPAHSVRDAAAITNNPNLDSGIQGDGDGNSIEVLSNQKFFRVLGVDAPPNRILRLGLLPVKDSKAPRTANIIKPTDHVFWTLTTGPQLGAFLQESFPQLDISALFTEEQLQAVATSGAGVFPRPQYLKHFTAALPQSRRSSSTLSSTADGPAPAEGPCCGVALVGDAVHCFPPDLGQGVNSAMQDVVGLAQALDEGDGDLARALPLYETRRAPEAAALTELVTFGAPYQYAQDVWGHYLWQANIRFRAFMAKLAPWAFSPQTFQLIQCTELMSYVQIRSLVHATTQRLWALGLTVATAVVAIAIHSFAAVGS